MTNLSEAQKRILKRDIMKDKMQVINYLVANDFLATASGYFIKISRRSPIVVFWDWTKEHWVFDCADTTITGIDFANLKGQIEELN